MSDTASIPPYLRYWGKSADGDDGRTLWHPLAYHSLDVAAVGVALLAAHDGLRRVLAWRLGWSEDAVRGVLPLLLALHDIGKFSLPFQFKRPELAPPEVAAHKGLRGGAHHDKAGLIFWTRAGPDLVDARLGADAAEDLRPLVRAVVGHHGMPPRDDDAGEFERLFGPAETPARAFACDAIDLLLPRDFAPPPLDGARLKRGSWLVAGLAVLADWIGSNRDWFPFRDPTLTLAQYWNEVAMPRAARAIDKAEVLPALRPSSERPAAFLPKDAEPSGAQRWAETVALPAGPAAFLIEDQTGSGKTEAAFILARRLIGAGRAEGVFVSLPTQATANGIYDRLVPRYEEFFGADAAPSLVLAHSGRDVHQRFQASILPTPRPEADYGASADAADESAGAACAGWIADDRRKAFLADVGVGTIDQALLAVLPSRHQSLRLVGLARRVLVVDEVHAYDPYMLKELGRLLAFQAALGGSAILLSATLPRDMRQRLLADFAAGAADDVDAAAPTPKCDKYPLASYWSATTDLVEESFAPRPDLGRAVPVVFLDGVEAALDVLAAAVARGEAACWIRNTVDDAIDGAKAVRARGLSADLFTARFTVSDRAAIERRVLDRFGKASTPDERRGHVLVATQVVEQSLDIDFDTMVTDLAPIDLVIQRAGRLWRHRDRPRLGVERLHVVAPPATPDPPQDWYSAMFRGASFVYRDHARLWLTRGALEGDGAICTPGRARELIEAVYGTEAEALIPPALVESHERFLTEAEGSAYNAHYLLLDLPKGYSRDGGRWDSDLRVPTREGKLQSVLRLARWDGNRLIPWADPTGQKPPFEAWRLSEITVRRTRIEGEAPVSDPVLAAAIERAKQKWSRWEKGYLLVPLTPVPGRDTWTGHAKTGKAARRIEYNSMMGLTFPQ